MREAGYLLGLWIGSFLEFSSIHTPVLCSPEKMEPASIIMMYQEGGQFMPPKDENSFLLGVRPLPRPL